MLYRRYSAFRCRLAMKTGLLVLFLVLVIEAVSEAYLYDYDNYHLPIPDDGDDAAAGTFGKRLDTLRDTPKKRYGNWVFDKSIRRYERQRPVSN